MSRTRGILSAGGVLAALAGSTVVAINDDSVRVYVIAAVITVVLVASITTALLVVTRFALRQTPEDRRVVLDVLRLLLGSERDSPPPKAGEQGDTSRRS